MRILHLQLTRQKNSLDPLRQISQHLHLRKHSRQYDCYMDIQSRKNYCTSRFLPQIKKGKKRTWMKTIVTMQNHGMQNPTSPMPIIKQRNMSFFYLLTVSNRCHEVRTYDCMLRIRSTCRIPSDEAFFRSGLSRHLTQRFFSLYISQVHFFSHLMKFANVRPVCSLIHDLWMLMSIPQSEKSTSSMKKQPRNE